MSPVSALDVSLSGLLIRLMFAARELALAQFSEQSNGAGPPAPAVTVCDFCRHTQGGDDRSHHSPACKVGVVLAVLAELEKFGPAIRQAAVDQIEREGRPGAAGLADDESEFPPGDFGEPWHIAADPEAVDARDGREVFHAGATELHEQDGQRFARRLAACVNLCSYAPTEVLEQAYQTMAAQFPRWILIAISAEHVTPAALAELTKHIDAMTAAGGRR